MLSPLLLSLLWKLLYSKTSVFLFARVSLCKFMFKKKTEQKKLLIHFLDKDECLFNNGGCSHTCTDTDGSYMCSCPEDFVLSGDLRTCVSIAGKICYYK